MNYCNRFLYILNKNLHLLKLSQMCFLKLLDKRKDSGLQPTVSAEAHRQRAEARCLSGSPPATGGSPLSQRKPTGNGRKPTVSAETHRQRAEAHCLSGSPPATGGSPLSQRKPTGNGLKPAVSAEAHWQRAEARCLSGSPPATGGSPLSQRKPTVLLSDQSVYG